MRLPAEFRFDGDKVFATRDDEPREVALSSRPGAPTWRLFYELMESVTIPADFMAARPMNAVLIDRDVFGTDV